MTIRTINRAAAIAAALAATAAVPAEAQAPRPTLVPDQPCYSVGDLMTFGGSGYTPGGKVSLVFSGRGLGFFESAADPAGRLAARLRLTEDNIENLLSNDEGEREIDVTATDQARTGDGTPDPEAFAAARVKVSRFAIGWNQTDDAMEPGRRLAFEAYGFTGFTGKPLYLHYVRGGRRVQTVRLGKLTGACGVLKKTLPRAFPRRIARPGRWNLVFGTSRTAATPNDALWIRIPVRIRR